MLTLVEPEGKYMKTLCFTMLVSASMVAQTVYYNHPKGVAIGGGSGG